MQVEDYKKEIIQKFYEFLDENDPNEAKLVMLLDAVTGLGIPECFVGSFYCSSYKSREAVVDLVFDEDFNDLVRSYAYHPLLMAYWPTKDESLGVAIKDGLPIWLGAEVCDCVARAVIFFEMLQKGELSFEEEDEHDGIAEQDSGVSNDAG